MPTFVHDTQSKHFVIVTPVRQRRPDSHIQPAANTPPVPHTCPFCPGNEKQTPPEVARLGTGEPNTPGWKIRVIPNKYPITDIHEVFILSTQHTADFPLLSLSHVQDLIGMFHMRYMAHKEKGNVLIFGNHGVEAGSSLPHPHAQMVVTPREIPFDAPELQPVANTIFASDTFTVYCPTYSQWPYEVWIAPKINGKTFGETTPEERNSLAFLMQQTIKTLRKVSEQKDFIFHKENKPLAYNYYISHESNYFVRIIPRLIHHAGYEFGSGLSVNIVPPENASEYLRTLWG